jgi:hypothetical protein
MIGCLPEAPGSILSAVVKAERAGILPQFLTPFQLSIEQAIAT